MIHSLPGLLNISKRTFHRFLSSNATILTQVQIESIDLPSGACGTAQLIKTSSSDVKSTTTIHIPGSVPGDSVLIKDYPPRKKKRQRGRKRGKKDKFDYRALETLVAASPHRIDPLCKHFKHCGGCTMQNINYSKQLELKEEWIRTEFLKASDNYDVQHKLLAPNLEFRPILGCTPTNIFGYRNKMEFTFSPREFYQEVDVSEPLEKSEKSEEPEESEESKTPAIPLIPIKKPIRSVLGLHPSRQTNSTRGRWHDKIVHIEECQLQSNDCNTILQYIGTEIPHTILPVYDLNLNEGFMKNLIIRTSHNNNENEIFIEFRTGVAVHSEWKQTLTKFAQDLVEKCNDLNIVGVVWTIDEQAKRHYEKRTTAEEYEAALKDQKQVEILHGNSYYNEKVHGMNFKVSQGAFFQPNPKQSELLFLEAAKLIDVTKNATIWDLYCGSGTVGLCLASNGKFNKLIGLEINPTSIQDAEVNTKLNKMSEMSSFHSIDLNNKNALSLLLQLDSPDVVVVDPPRAGLHPQIIARMKELAVYNKNLKIVYISCNPVTLARDIAIMCEGNALVPKIVQPVDMLPHTAHLEAIVLVESK